MHWLCMPASINIMIADALVPNSQQTFNNHADSQLSTLYAVLPLFTTRFAACTGGMCVSLLEACLF